MSRLRAIAVAVVLSAIGLAGCGSQREALVSVNITPTTAAATHGSANGTVQFTANGNFAKYGNYMDSTARGACVAALPDVTRVLSQVDWATSDSANTSIDASGMAKCLGTTATPATVTAIASGICGGVKATATLSCN